MLRSYHATLVANGVSGYSFEDMMMDYRRGLLIAMAIPVNGFGTIEQMLETGGGDLDQEQRTLFDQAMASGMQLISAMSNRTVAATIDNNAAMALDR